MTNIRYLFFRKILILLGSIDILTVADFDHMDHKCVIFDRIHNSIDSLAYPVPILPGEFLATAWARIVGQVMYAIYNSSAISAPWDLLDLPGSRCLDQDSIFSHDASDP